MNFAKAGSIHYIIIRVAVVEDVDVMGGEVWQG